MDDLSKTQVVLLVLFVSFVTSIATGIVTVTLMSQTPQSVTQTINQVVEKTVERVIPGETKVKEVRVNVPIAATPTDEDLLANAIAQSIPAVVKIYGVKKGIGENATTSITTELPAGSGFMILPTSSAIAATGGDKNSRFLVTGFSVVQDKELVYEIVTSDGKIYRVKYLAGDGERNIAIMQIQDISTLSQPYLELAKAGPVLGKTVFAPAFSDDSDTVAIGSVTGVRPGGASTTPMLATTLIVRASAVGSPILDTRGVIVGMVTGEQMSAHVSLISALLDSIKKLQ